ncbi:MAG TPA: hypothetical protein VM165_23565 [Planctomycetaceae bacterium]|nr:hypothetical protein [Planctomycetaceae bacterium]
MFGKILLLAATATAGVLMTADNADARVGVYRGPNATVVRVGGARYGAYGYGGYGGYGYNSGYYAAPAYGYSYPSYSYATPVYSTAYSYPTYGYSYGYPSYGYGYGYGGGYYGGYRGGRTFASGPNGYYYRGPNVRVGRRY